MIRAWFTADLHFGHRAILRYTNRPFADLDEMRTMVISNWNRHVRPNDDVYVLGDFSFEPKAQALETFEALQGRKHLIVGNHDGDSVRKLPWESVSPLKTFRGGEGVRIVLCHYPMLTWDQAHRGTWHLHGHAHTNINHLNEGQTRLDVGLDNHPDWRPFSLAEVVERLSSTVYEPVDHHA